MIQVLLRRKQGSAAAAPSSDSLLLVAESDGPHVIDGAGVDRKLLSSAGESEHTASATATLAEEGAEVTLNLATVAVAYTVQPNSSVAFPIGSRLRVWRKGAAASTVVAGAGVTINGTTAGTAVTLAAQYDSVTLIKIGTNTWLAK